MKRPGYSKTLELADKHHMDIKIRGCHDDFVHRFVVEAYFGDAKTGEWLQKEGDRLGVLVNQAIQLSKDPEAAYNAGWD